MPVVYDKIHLPVSFQFLNYEIFLSHCTLPTVKELEHVTCTVGPRELDLSRETKNISSYLVK